MSDYAPNHTVVPQDSILNTLVAHVIGNKTDTVAGTSIVSLLQQALAGGAADQVPAQDSADNVLTRDVAGNKTDTVAGNSLVSLARVTIADIATAIADIATVDGLHDVPAVDSALNLIMSQVLGQKGDTHDGNSAMAMLHTLDEHFHSPGFVLPDRTDAIAATAGAAGPPYVYGAATASLGTPADDFDLHFADVLALNNNVQYQARILVDGVERDVITFTSGPAAARSGKQPLQTNVLPPGPITIQLAANLLGAQASFKVKGHLY
jgi:hypothetical protein